MCTRIISVLVTSLVLGVAGLLPDAANAQIRPAGPAVPSSASESIGKIVVATGAVTIERADAMVVQANVPGPTSQTKVGDLVYRGDVVRTGADGRVGINFTDGTSFNLSSNAQMALNEFVYEPDGKSNSTMFNLNKGTFTFVAGKIAKTGDMKIDTPVATMGIRGTTPHVEISDDGTTKFSTLVEEGRSKLEKRVRAPAAEPSQRHKFDFKICRGC